jgi:hypothetical protein
MKPYAFYAGSTITASYHNTADCTDAITDSFALASGECYKNYVGYRFKYTAATATGSSPVSAPTTAIYPVSSPVGTPSRSAPTAVGALSGFFFMVGYTDSACTAVGYAEVYPLNICFFYAFEEGQSYAKFTATSDQYVIQQYSDSACMTAVGTAQTTSYTTACGYENTKFFVQSTNEVSTTKATAISR